MADSLPLLLFPQAKSVLPSKSTGRKMPSPHFPEHDRQRLRLTHQLDKLKKSFARMKADINWNLAGLEPETALIIEIAGNVSGFKGAVEKTAGLEWLAEQDLEDIEADRDFYVFPKIGPHFFESNPGISADLSKEIHGFFVDNKLVGKNDKLLSVPDPEFRLSPALAPFRTQIFARIEEVMKQKPRGRLFLSMSNQQGLNELLDLWKKWSLNQRLPDGKLAWKTVFSQILEIRRWGIKEILEDTGMIEAWRELLENEPFDPNALFPCQIELFYCRNEKRRKTETGLKKLLSNIGGQLDRTIDIPEIGFHAIKVQLLGSQIQNLIKTLDQSGDELDIELFKCPGIKHFRPTGQALDSHDESEGEPFHFTGLAPELDPIVAILDGVPNVKHKALNGRILLDDPEDLSHLYQPGEMIHGTCMASLVIYGDLSNEMNEPLLRKVYYSPILQPDPNMRSCGIKLEYLPDDIFFEDRVRLSLQRMFDGVLPQAAGVKIINLSIGDSDQHFSRFPSSWAMLLDWLSFKYRVLFCVSAGNFDSDIELAMNAQDFKKLPDDEKTSAVFCAFNQQLNRRRLIAPGEAINAITVGALHEDDSKEYIQGGRFDILPSKGYTSPTSRIGLGFRQSIKPDIFLPGGRQLYENQISDERKISPRRSTLAPGQKVACTSPGEGNITSTRFTCGTSNATALATRCGAQIYEVLNGLRDEDNVPISDGLMAVLIKTLLAHGAQPLPQTVAAVSKIAPGAKKKKMIARFSGYGCLDVKRVLACTEQRGTVLGCGEIQVNEVHEYRFPLPFSLSEQKKWRRMVVTLAWFTPINPNHGNLRKAKLEFQPASKWHKQPLMLKRTTYDYSQVKRGTVQHEVLEADNQMSCFKEDSAIFLHVTCKKDATESLHESIPYGLAVSLEVAEGVNLPIYNEIRAKIRTPKIRG